MERRRQSSRILRPPPTSKSLWFRPRRQLAQQIFCGAFPSSVFGQIHDEARDGGCLECDRVRVSLIPLVRPEKRALSKSQGWFGSGRQDGKIGHTRLRLYSNALKVSHSCDGNIQ